MTSNAPVSLRVVTNGQTLTISATRSDGASFTWYTDQGLTQPIGTSKQISADTQFWMPLASAGEYTVSARLLDGTELWGKKVFLLPGTDEIIEPLPQLRDLVRYLNRTVQRTQGGLGKAPADHGFTAWSEPLTECGNNGLLGTAGTVVVRRLWIPPGPITNLHVNVVIAGATLTASQNLAGLFDASKNLLSATADQSAAWVSTGVKTMALTAVQYSVGAYFFAGFFFNGTTSPSLLRAGVSTTGAAVNGALSGNNLIAASADTGRTTSFPATLGALTANGNAFWVATS